MLLCLLWCPPLVQPEQTRKRMKMVMRFLALIMVPFTMNMPAGVFCYWTASNLFSLVQVGRAGACPACMSAWFGSHLCQWNIHTRP